MNYKLIIIIIVIIWAIVGLIIFVKLNKTGKAQLLNKYSFGNKNFITAIHYRIINVLQFNNKNDGKNDILTHFFIIFYLFLIIICVLHFLALYYIKV